MDVLLQSKLDDYQVRKNSGERLNQDQLVGTLKPSSLWKNYQIICVYVQRFYNLVIWEMSFQEALSKYQEIMNNLEFAKELQKTFIALGQDVRMDAVVLKLF